MCPDTTEADVDGHTAAFRTMCVELVDGKHAQSKLA